MSRIIEKLDPIPPNSNPYHYDLTRMGKDLDKTHHLMYAKFDNNEYVIIVHIPTGERRRIDLKKLFKQ